MYKDHLKTAEQGLFLSQSIESEVIVGRDSFPIVWTPSYSEKIINPNPNEFLNLWSGRTSSVKLEGEPVLLLPLQANGRCAANCQGCVFAKDFVSDHRLANPVDINKMATLLIKSYDLHPAEKFRVSPLLSGDPAFNKHTFDLIMLISTQWAVSKTRWSTIAAEGAVNPLEEMLKAATKLKERQKNEENKLRVQVSLHSTDPDKRREHVEFHSKGTENYLRLIDIDNISQYMNEISLVTGNASTLAFVLNSGSDIDPDILDRSFSKDSVWISLRPMINTDDSLFAPIEDEKALGIYYELRQRGWNVIVMPPSISKSEQKNPILDRNIQN